MNRLTNLKIKYRLLLVLILPSLILLGFVASFSKNEFRIVQEARSVADVMTFIERIIKLNQALNIEGILSKSSLSYEKFSLRTELSTARSVVDNILSSLREDNKNASESSKNNNIEAVEPILTKLESLSKRRAEIDAKSISPKAAFDYYDSIEPITNEAINKLIDKVKEYPKTRRLYLVLALSNELMANLNVVHLGVDALNDNKLSNEDYQFLLKEIGKQQGARDIAKDFALPSEEALLNENYNKEAWRTVEKMSNRIIDKGLTGPYDVKPQEWLESQMSKGEIIVNMMDTFINQNRKAIDELEEEYTHNLIIVLIITLITLSLVLYIIIKTLRNLSRKLEDEVGVLSTSGEEILRSISEASSGVVETAAAVTETTTTVEELRQTAQVSADKAKNVAEVSDEALNTLQTSEKTVNETIEWMNRIHDGMGTISESILKLSEHGKMIREIIDTVNDLAEQSHLLAVNAAIEAAKAGEQGKGFAVVAQEVRSLADQSKQATVQVKNILNDIQNATNAAVMATEQGSKAVSHGLTQSSQTGESIRSLSTGINNVAQAAAQISLSSQQQLIGVNQVTIAMTNIKTASDQHVDHMRQIEGGVQGLNTVGKSLKEQVVQYKL